MSVATEFESRRYRKLMAAYEALKNANHDAIAMLHAGDKVQAIKDLQRGNKISAEVLR